MTADATSGKAVTFMHEPTPAEPRDNGAWESVLDQARLQNGQAMMVQFCKALSTSGEGNI
jgi:hypothetical protein